MAMKLCRECKKEVSTEARTCPHCGAPRPTGQGFIVRIWSIGFLIILAWGAVKFEAAYRADQERQASHPDEPHLDSRTGRPFLDFNKPIYAIAGAPLCLTENELDAYSKHAPNGCGTLGEDAPVIEMEMKGILLPVHRIRLKEALEPLDLWTVHAALRN